MTKKYYPFVDNETALRVKEQVLIRGAEDKDFSLGFTARYPYCLVVKGKEANKIMKRLGYQEVKG